METQWLKPRTLLEHQQSGNGPAYIERSANVPHAVKQIMDSKTFDNGTICASEQSIIVETVNREAVKELIKQGAYFLSPAEADKLAKFILRPNGTMNPQIVGRSVQHIASLVGLSIPKDRRLIVAEETHVGLKYPFSRENWHRLLLSIQLKTGKQLARYQLKF